MKKRSLVIGLLLAGALAMTACGGDKQPASTNSEVNTQNSEFTTQTDGDVVIQEPVDDDVIPEGMVMSDLTGEYIDESIANQRPITVMVDNEKTALPHYGLTKADIVYEMVNSTKNDQVTRLMVMVKDWDSIERLGNVRSARVTNCVLTKEWNAILCHDGGVYLENYLGFADFDNLSGLFSRIDRPGKAREFTEYITTGEIAKFTKNRNIETEYNNYYEGTHFTFAKNVDLAGDTAATKVDLSGAFWHNKSKLDYNADDQLYYYSEYGEPHLDPGNGNAQLSFKNVIIQKADLFTQTVKQADGTVIKDPNGYMYYELSNSSGKGYYLVNGEMTEITWKKGEDASPTQYFDANGNELVLNVGKTYIAIVPSANWDDIVIK